jgi:hypothetical protein
MTLMSEAAEAKRTHVSVSVSIDGGEDNPLAVIRGITTGMRNIDQQLRNTVEDARRRGHSWQEIADALGVSRQSAWERFARPEDEERARVVRDVMGSLKGPGPTSDEMREIGRQEEEEIEERKRREGLL